MIKVCENKCRHEYQDDAYGKGRRVMNKMRSMGGGAKARCTVCGKESTASVKKKT